jgi:hypothetical protein
MWKRAILATRVFVILRGVPRALRPGLASRVWEGASRFSMPSI